MKTVLSYILSSLYYFYFGLVLAIFHPIQVIAHWVFGDRARKKVVDVLNFFLVYGLIILGSRIKFKDFEKVPEGRPVVIISNHQSMFDIPPIVLGFKKCYPKFISKESLAKNLPSISYNLRHGKSALIDRSKGSAAVKEIFKLGRLIEKTKTAACIFPEGTRSKTGKVGTFKVAGVNALLRAAPSTIIVPFVIDGHSKLLSKGLFPLQIGLKISYTVLDPVEPGDTPVEEILSQVEYSIKKSLNQV
jgi:1-acyl-sn-glycerol-3-phosphate acyltransferase